MSGLNEEVYEWRLNEIGEKIQEDSDTFIIKQNGLKCITSDPRDLESNILRK